MNGYVLSLEDEIPLPHQYYVLEIPNQFSDIPSSSKEIVFLLNNSKTKKLNISSFGILAEYQAADETEHLTYVTFKCLKRVVLKQVENLNLNTTKFCDVAYEIEQIDEATKWLIDDFHQKIKKSQVNVFTSQQVEELSKLDQTENIFYALANIFLKSEKQKVSFLEKTSFLEAWAFLLSEIETIQKKKKQVSVSSKTDSDSIEDLFATKLENLDIDSSIKNKIASEIDKLKRTSKASTDYNMHYSYVDFALSLPWNATQNLDYDIGKVQTALEENHYGLESVKQSIIEYLVIEKISQKNLGTVMCFYGNPGSGKTSLARSIATAINRPLISLALGGMNDEHELRGFQKTYIGAKPGRIASGIKNVNSFAPVILLDEIDKIGSTRGGADPSSALLEILDPNQNAAFLDKYLDFPIDLSKTIFICTANEPEAIYSALKDRMELIHFPDYSQIERQFIIENYIIDKLIKNYNLADFNIRVQSEVIIELAKQDKQLRTIERKLAKSFRHLAAKIYFDKTIDPVIDLNLFTSLYPSTIHQRKFF